MEDGISCSIASPFPVVTISFYPSTQSFEHTGRMPGRTTRGVDCSNIMLWWLATIGTAYSSRRSFE